MINQLEGIEERNSTVVEQLRAAFERDWFSNYTRSLQANKMPICNKHQINKLASVKAVPIKTGQHGNGPAPVRNTHKHDGQTTLNTRHRDNRLNKISYQGVVNGLMPIIDSYPARGRVKMSHLGNRPVQIKDIYHNNLTDPPGQSAESSGSREISNGSL